MTTITERVKELYCDADGNAKNVANNYMRFGYLQGANEMLIKACSKFCDQCNRNYTFIHAKDCSLNRATCEKLNTFRKALENEND